MNITLTHTYAGMAERDGEREYIFGSFAPEWDDNTLYLENGEGDRWLALEPEALVAR